MGSYHFTKEQARRMLLSAQGFGSEWQPVDGERVAQCIDRMGVLQIDTIHVVARSPYLVLWSRLGAYDPVLLDALLADRRIFEYWSHEACFIPVDEFPLYRRMIMEARKKPRVFQWLKARPHVVSAMLEHVREHGETRSSDFVRTDGQKGNWWNWKEEKIALDHLHTAGELMITRRERFQRIYDLRERVAPLWNDENAPPYSEVVERLVQKAVDCLGVCRANWVADYFRLLQGQTQPALKLLVSRGDLVPANIGGFGGPCYVSTRNIPLAESVLGGESLRVSTLLSPFDPVVWDRKRCLELFGFDYRIECYVPESKRKYGYFVLPILLDSALVGRLDAKAHRIRGAFEVKSLYLEPGTPASPDQIGRVAQSIGHCAAWHGCPEVEIRSCPEEYRSTLTREANAAAESGVSRRLSSNG